MCAPWICHPCVNTSWKPHVPGDLLGIERLHCKCLFLHVVVHQSSHLRWLKFITMYAMCVGPLTYARCLSVCRNRQTFWRCVWISGFGAVSHASVLIIRIKFYHDTDPLSCCDRLFVENTKILFSCWLTEKQDVVERPVRVCAGWESDRAVWDFGPWFARLTRWGFPPIVHHEDEGIVRPIVLGNSRAGIFEFSQLKSACMFAQWLSQCFSSICLWTHWVKITQTNNPPQNRTWNVVWCVRDLMQSENFGRARCTWQLTATWLYQTSKRGQNLLFHSLEAFICKIYNIKPAEIKTSLHKTHTIFTFFTWQTKEFKEFTEKKSRQFALLCTIRSLSDGIFLLMVDSQAVWYMSSYIKFVMMYQTAWPIHRQHT